MKIDLLQKSLLEFFLGTDSCQHLCFIQYSSVA